MPAVTVADLTILPRIPVPTRRRPPARRRELTTAPQRLRGRGIPGPPRVRRRSTSRTSTRSSSSTRWARWSTRPGRPRARPTPAPRLRDRDLHARRQLRARDSNGGGGVITNGDTQWMTAGAGIVHIEMPPEGLVDEGGLFHGFQLWVNLPAGRSGGAALPGHPRGRGGPAGLARRRRAASGHRRRDRGHAGPGSTYTPITGPRHAPARARGCAPWRPDFNALAYVLDGSAPRPRAATVRRVSWRSSAPGPR